MKSKFLDAIMLMALLLTVVSGFAHTWEKTDSGKFHDSIRMSADGRIICAVDSGSHLISTDSGKTWHVGTNYPPIGGPGQNGIAVSADGTKIHAVVLDQSSWLSTNQGLSWVQTGFPAAAAWQIACSGDGTKVIAASYDGPLCFSTNSGENCYTSSVPNAKWASIVSSADGKRMVSAVAGGDVYFSTNFGVDWASAGFSSRTWNSVCVSANGKWVGALTDTNAYISGNAGADWFTNNFGGGTIACSADGTTWMIAAGQIYTSTDGGIDWLTNLPTISSYNGAISADGSEIAIVEYDGIWMGRATSSPKLNIQSEGSSIALSWLVPSTNFVLQQNVDLCTTNWMTVSNSPALNFTNLQQEVTVPATTNTLFFRLVAQ
jgi:hypothetical protein